jgi:hypothetical protein
MGEILATWLIETFALTAAEAAVASFAIQMVASSIVSSTFASDPPNSGLSNQSSLNTGVNLQVAPATNNKLPVVYGNSFIGGTITDLSITTDNQDLYYVMSLCEVTGGSSPDTITFGDIYFGGKLCVFDGTDQTKVVGLTDQSTGTTDNTVSGHLYIYLYNNGSNSPVNSSQSAISVMQSSGLTYTWDSTKLMSNCTFAIVHLNYNQNAGITNIQQTQFEITNSRNSAGDVLYDYLSNTRYGAAIPTSQIDTASLTALNTYCNQVITFTPYTGGSATQPRFKMNGFIDTTKPVMQNLQVITDSCDCLLKYNEIYGQWSAVVQSPTYTVAMNINDSNMISTIGISSLDISNTFNIAQCQYPDITINSAFNTTQIDLATVAPDLLYPNEPVNLQTIQLNLCNNNVQAQLLGTRFLKSARMDLQVTCSINFVGLQLEAGDIVTVTNANYGWVAKLFRISKVVQRIANDGAITADLTLMNFDPTVFDDASITQFNPPDNTGLPDPNIFGTVPAPTISNILVSAPIPSFQVNVTTSSAGITQYAEVWYSAFSSPSASQLIFAGTTAVQSNGIPYGNSVAMPPVTVSGIPTGNWYFFSRMVNSMATSAFSPASSAIDWRPLTFQFSERYLSVAYGTSTSGAGFSLNPNGKTYFGLYNQSGTGVSTNPSDYTWYDANPDFGSDNFLLYSNRQSRIFSFATGGAVYASQTGSYVPSDTATFDQSLWSALPNSLNIIDLDARTGQLIRVGTSAVSSADGLIKVVNNQTGQIIAQLDRFLNFGEGVNQKTFPVSALTIDVFGRVVGVVDPDTFYFTATVFTATAGQTSFSVTHTVGQVLVFKNGILLGLADYTETSTTVVLGVACYVNDRLVILNMRAISTLSYYEPLNITVASVATSTVTYSTSSSPYQYINAGDKITFVNAGTPTQYTVSTVNYTTRQITFTTSPTGLVAGTPLYRYRNAGTSYTPFSRYDITWSAGSSYIPTTWDLRSGFELVFVNGSIYNEIDYDITSGALNGFPDVVSGSMSVIQFAENSFSVPCSAVTNTLTTTVTGQTVYSFDHNTDAFQIYANGAMLVDNVDFTENPTTYTLAVTPTNSYTILQQQTFARAGAA